MQVYSGKSVFRGIAIGKISVYRKNEQQVKRVRTEDTKGELARYEVAKAAAVEQLQELYQKALKEVGEANAAIFEIHQMMLDDGVNNESVENIIETQKVNAEYAVAVTGDNFAQMFRAMDDDYMRERAADVKDISERVLSVLHGGQKRKVVTGWNRVIIVADVCSVRDGTAGKRYGAFFCHGSRFGELPYRDPCKNHGGPGTDRNGGTAA